MYLPDDFIEWKAIDELKKLEEQIRNSNYDEKILIRNIIKELKKPKIVPKIYFHRLRKYGGDNLRKIIEIKGVKYFNDYEGFTNKELTERAKSNLKFEISQLDEKEDLLKNFEIDCKDLLAVIHNGIEKMESLKKQRIQEIEIKKQKLKNEKARSIKEKKEIEEYSKAKFEIDLKYKEGLNFFNSSKYPEAIYSFTQAIKLDKYGKEEKDLYFQRGLAKFEVSDFIGCINDINISINRFSENQVKYFKAGLAYLYLKDYKKAIINFNFSIDFDFEHKESYFYRGLAKIYYYKDINEDKDKLEGCLDLSKAGELGYFEAYDEIKKHCS